jgi:hypothetical protein
MPEQNKPFVITDRRKFTLDGQPRLDADPSPEKVRPAVPPPAESSARIVENAPAEAAKPAAGPTPVAGAAGSPAAAAKDDLAREEYYDDPNAPPPPTAEQMEQSKLAFDATADRLDVAIRAANPGMEHAPAMNFDRLVQSIYMTTVMQLGGGTPEGQKPQVDLLGARQSVDMLTVIAEKTAGNLTRDEQRLLDSALFEVRLAFLDVTQALSRSAAAKAAPGTPGFGPSIVR